MTKWIIVVLLFLFTTLASAQFETEVYETEWFLRNLRVEGFNRQIPLSSEVYPITMNINESSPPVFTTAVCATLTMDIDVENAGVFTISSAIEVTDEVCKIKNNQNFQDLYLSFFSGSPEEGYIYSLTPSTQNPNELLFFIAKPNNDQARYSSIPILNVSQRQLEEIVLFPNPARDFVDVQHTREQLLYYTIYTTSGKIVNAKETLKHKKIDTQLLTPGVYFIVIENQQLNKNIKKLIIK